MAKTVARKDNVFTVFEQILITVVLVFVGLYITAHVGGWIETNWSDNGQIVCKSVLYVLGLITMWLIFLDIAVKRVFKY